MSVKLHSDRIGGFVNRQVLTLSTAVFVTCFVLLLSTAVQRYYFWTNRFVTITNETNQTLYFDEHELSFNDPKIAYVTIKPHTTKTIKCAVRRVIGRFTIIYCDNWVDFIMESLLPDKYIIWLKEKLKPNISSFLFSNPFRLRDHNINGMMVHTVQLSNLTAFPLGYYATERSIFGFPSRLVHFNFIVSKDGGIYLIPYKAQSGFRQTVDNFDEIARVQPSGFPICIMHFKDRRHINIMGIFR